jgi:hypothetical protein
MESLRIMPATPRPGRDGLSRIGDARAESIVRSHFATDSDGFRSAEKD